MTLNICLTIYRSGVWILYCLIEFWHITVTQVVDTLVSEMLQRGRVHNVDQFMYIQLKLFTLGHKSLRMQYFLNCHCRWSLNENTHNYRVIHWCENWMNVKALVQYLRTQHVLHAMLLAIMLLQMVSEQVITYCIYTVRDRVLGSTFWGCWYTCPNLTPLGC